MGFGPQAERFTARLPAGARVIAADISGGTLGLAAAVEHRRAGLAFCAAPLIDEPRALLAQRSSGAWFEERTGVDARYRIFDALAEDQLEAAGIAGAQELHATIDEPARRVLRDFAVMGDALLVRSSRETERIARLLTRRRPAVIAAPGIDPTVPGVSLRAREAIVVWAPELDASALGVIAMALDAVKTPVLYVCASGRLSTARGEFLPVALGPAALERAACIIDASISDPAPAIALAQIGAPVVASATAGSAEFLSGVYEYDPWNWRTIHAAVAASRAAAAPSQPRSSWPAAEIERTLERNAPPQLSSEPRVSIVLATYNRRDLLPVMLDALRDQTYRNFEVIVVNDGGADVSDIVPRYPFARLITLPENRGTTSALVAGLEAMTGEFFGFASDDDDLFPDHIARLSAALVRSGGDVAHSNAVTRYVTEQSGERETLAFRVRHDRTPDRLQLLVGGTFVFSSMLFRRRVLDEIGTLDTALLPADYEYQLRCFQRYDFIHVDVVTYEWHYRVDGGSLTHSATDDAMIGGIRTIYARYPSDPSEIVELRRAAEIKRYERRSEALLWPPDLFIPGKEERG